MLFDGVVPTPTIHKLAKAKALEVSLRSGLYPKFLGSRGPSESRNPSVLSPLDYVKLLWPDCLCELIALETNRYANQEGAKRWVDTSANEIWVFLGIVCLMGVKRLPRIRNYWSQTTLLGDKRVKQAMSYNRFMALWAHLHCVDNHTLVNCSDPNSKIKPIVDIVSHRFLASYHPSQELSVDEAMVKYKGRKGGKVRMPHKPIKLGFKVWCLSCSCCGYLCTFQIYHGRPTDPTTGKKVSEKGLTRRVVTELVSTFVGSNHVIYCDNFFTSGPLIDCLSQHKVYVVGTIKQNASGFPSSLKGVKPPKGNYLVQTVGDIRYFVFNDRKVVCFATNVFPEHMPEKVARLQPEGVLRLQCVPPPLPAYNKYMGGVDLTNQMRSLYGYGRKSVRYWLRLAIGFLFDSCICNAFLLSKHDHERLHLRPTTQLDFRVAIMEDLLPATRKKYTRGFSRGIVDNSQAIGVCELVKAEEIGLKRGRCHYCLRADLPKKAHTVYACSMCRVRLCIKNCFSSYHAGTS